jgi:integrase
MVSTLAGFVRDRRNVLDVTQAELARISGVPNTCATLLARRGVPAHRIKELLGHSSVAVTMDIYAHVLEQDRADTAAEMDRVFGESVSGGEERELGVR